MPERKTNVAAPRAPRLISKGALSFPTFEEAARDDWSNDEAMKRWSRRL